MTHINHYQEVSPDMAAAVKKITSTASRYVTRRAAEPCQRPLPHPGRDLQANVLDRRASLYLLQCHKEKGLYNFIHPYRWARST